MSIEPMKAFAVGRGAGSLAEHGHVREIRREPLARESLDGAVGQQIAERRVEIGAQGAPFGQDDAVALAGLDPARERPVAIG